MRIAIVAEGVESTRQVHADGGHFLCEVGRSLKLSAGNASAELFTDKQVVTLLQQLEDGAFDAVVFGSNSVRHPESQVVEALSRYPNAIPSLLERDGGVLVLHQFVAGALPIRIGESIELAYARRSGEVAEYTLQRMDPVLHLPNPIGTLDLMPGSGSVEQPYWMAIDMQSAQGLSPVISSGRDVLVARSSDEAVGRVVACSLPLDWHRSRDLLPNLMRFVVAGVPNWVVWPQEGGVLSPEMAKIVAERPRSQVALPECDAEWLSNLAATHLYPGTEELREALSKDSARDVLRRGGSLLSVTTAEHAAVDASTRVVAYVGGQATEIAQMFNTQRLLGGDQWRLSSDVFPKRNVILAQAYFDKLLGSQEVDLPGSREFSSSVSYQGITITSMLAVAQTFAIVYPKSKEAVEFRDAHVRPALEHSDDKMERVLLAAADAALSGDESAVDRWLSALGQLRAEELNVVTLIRILEWCWVMSTIRAASLTASMEQDISSLAGRAIDASEGGLCVSIEGTASVVLAICSLGRQVALQAMARAASCVSVLKEELNRLLGLDSPPISPLARITHALAAAELVSPDGLGRLSKVLSPFDSEGKNHQISTTERRLARSNRELLAQVRRFEQMKSLMHIGKATMWVIALASVFGALAVALMLARDLKIDWFVVAGPFLSAGLGYLYLQRFRRWGILPRRLLPALDWLEHRFGFRSATDRRA